MKKYLRIASDLHLEGFIGRDAETLALDFLPKDARDDQSILILAGDVSSSPEQLIRFLSACMQRFWDVIFVPGNHEYYRHHFHQWNIDTETDLVALHQAHLKDGKHLYFATDSVQYADIGGIRFIFGTLWGDGGPTLEDQAKTGFYLNDFRLIRAGDGFVRFTVQDMITQYKRAKFGIESALSAPFAGKKIVVTHHLPSRRLVSARFWPGDGSDGANGGFVGNCDDILARTEIAPALWIHGHTHDTINTTLWNTRVVCNPAGYRGEWMSKHNSFMQPGDNGQRETVPVFVDLDSLEVC